MVASGDNDKVNQKCFKFGYNFFQAMCHEWNGKTWNTKHYCVSLRNKVSIVLFK